MLERDKDGILRELEAGSSAVTATEIGIGITREVGIMALRPPWWRRAWERIVAWFRRRRDDEVIVTAGMGAISRRQHREMMRFARESGNGAMVECLRKKA